MSDTPSKRGRKRLDGISAKEGQAPLIGVRLSSPIHAIVEDLATAKGVKPPVILREALDAYLGKGPPPALRAQVAVAVAGEGWGELASIVERERVSDVLAALGEVSLPAGVERGVRVALGGCLSVGLTFYNST